MARREAVNHPRHPVPVQVARRGAISHPQLPTRLKSASRNRPGYREADIVPCDFHGLGQIQLVCLKSGSAQSREPSTATLPPAQKRALYNRPDCREADIVPCDFRGLGPIRLVCLKRWLGATR